MGLGSSLTRGMCSNLVVAMAAAWMVEAGRSSLAKCVSWVYGAGLLFSCSSRKVCVVEGFGGLEGVGDRSE